jgi:hypothetical protein
MARGAVILALVGLIASGCGSSSSKAKVAGTDETPDAFMKRLLEYDFKGQYGRSYDLLHPGQQPFVSREKFQDCAQASASEDAELQSIKTVEVYDDPLHSPGVPQTTSKAVTLKITVRAGTETGAITRTMHAVNIGTRWAWVLRSSDVASYKAGECPTG